MKKISIIFSAAALALTMFSCNKEKGIAPSPSQNIDPTTYAYKYQEVVTIFDATNTYSIKLALRSDNKSVVDATLEQYKNSELKLYYTKPANMPKPERNVGQANPPAPMFDANGIEVHLLESNVGNALGYGFEMAGSNARVLITGFNLVSYSGFTCSTVYYELKYGTNVTAYCYYNSGSSWVYENSTMLSAPGANTYMGSTYAQKLNQYYKPATFIGGYVVLWS